MTNIVHEYLNYHDQYSQKYGSKTLVLMQVGSFYECYQTLDRGPNLKDIASMLNIVCTRKDKKENEISTSNPIMCGVPCIASNKFIKLLINNGYTIIVIDQVTPPPKPVRKITGIYSPGTYIENLDSADSNYIVCLYFEEEVQKFGFNLLCCGMSAMELSTGHCYVHEATSSNNDTKFSADEAIRFINSLNPTEIIIYYQKSKNNPNYFNKLLPYLELDNKNYNIKHDMDKKYEKIAYQNELLNKIYKNCGPISPIEYLNLERYNYARISFVILLDFAYEHNEKIINNLYKPLLYIDNTRMILGNNANYQLNITESNLYNENYGHKYKSLFDVINNTSTPLGKRFLKFRITSPLISHTELEKIYEHVDQFIANDFYKIIETNLAGISDIERFERKMSLSLLHPYDFVYFYESCKEIIKICDSLKTNNKMLNILPDDNQMKLLNQFIDTCDKTFLFDELKKYSLYNISGSLFVPGCFKDLDSLKNSMQLGKDYMEELCKVLSDYIDDPIKRNKTMIKKNGRKKSLKNTEVNSSETDEIFTDRKKITVKKNGKYGYYLSLSKPRASSLRENLLNVEKITIQKKDLLVTNLIYNDLNKSNTIITIANSRNNLDVDEMTENEDQLVELTKKHYIETIGNLYDQYHNLFVVLCQLISYVDYIKSSAKTAALYGYCKPKIEYNPKCSFVKCKNLRHPIIEKIIEHEFVPHSFELGQDLKGMLIFSPNSGGKCFDPNTDIMLYDCSTKKAKDIIVGDILMGDDSTPRKVITTTTGYDQMYKISLSSSISGFPYEYKLEYFIVNGPHILCLKNVNNVTINKLSDVLFDVIWFDNDNEESNKFQTLEEANIFAEKIKNRKILENIIEITVTEYLKKSDNWKRNYLLYRNPINSEDWPREDRLNLLANIIDKYHEKTNIDNLFIKLRLNNLIFDRTKFLIRSLGFDYKETNDFCLYIIKSSNICDIPTKKLVLINSNFDNTDTISFNIEKINYGQYCGFEVDNNSRFLLGNFIVTHNSSLMKSLGMAVVMAQSGLYVPATEFVYSPYTAIYTRIIGIDNIFKGLSSFALEMVELNSILKRANSKTLILGDEVCKGTEHISGNAIVASTIVYLAKLESSFIFATHLHEIMKLDCITNLKTVKAFHLTVDYNEKTDVLVYGRSLKDGPGEQNYGITFAKHIIHNNEFIKQAVQIKNELLKIYDNIISGKTSRYNSNLLVYECFVCGKTDQKLHSSPLETHHINFQKDCTNDIVNNKPHLKKNDKANLVVLCNECHDNIHSNKLSIEGYVMTSQGPSIKIKRDDKERIINKNRELIV